MKRLFIFLLCLAFGCGKPLPKFENVDLDKWKNDKNGCKGERLKMFKLFDAQKDKLKGLSEDEILKLLGRPDRNELYKRSQKFYEYFIEPGPVCRNDSSDLILSVRFNAVGLAKEISVVAID